ncbi:MAG: Par-6 cell polarity regulator gamma [Paramarteilia canceri]
MATSDVQPRVVGVKCKKDLESVIVKILANDDLLRLEIDPKNSNHKKSAIISVEFDKNFSKTITFLRNSKTEPLGFHIRKGLSTKSTSNCKLERFDGFFVSRIKKGHILTSRNDLLDINDEIVSIDKKPTAGKDLETIADEISQLVGNCEIKIIPYIYTDKVQNDSEDFQTNANLLIDKILAIPSTTTSMSDLDC